MPEAPVEAQLIAMQIRDELYRMATIVHDPRNDAKALISRHIDGVHALMGAIGGGGATPSSNSLRWALAHVTRHLPGLKSSVARRELAP